MRERWFALNSHGITSLCRLWGFFSNLLKPCRNRPEIGALDPEARLPRRAAIRLPAAVEKRLARLAKRTGRTKTYYAREAILEHLDDLEDIYLAEQAYAPIQRGKSRTIPLEEAMKRRGIRASRSGVC